MKHCLPKNAKRTETNEHSVSKIQSNIIDPFTAQAGITVVTSTGVHALTYENAPALKEKING